MPEVQPGLVTVADIYREVVAMRAEMARALTRIEVIGVQNAEADKLHADHETRLRALEAFRWKLAGVMLVIGVLAGLLSGWLSSGHY